MSNRNQAGGGLIYRGTNAVAPPNVFFERRDPTQYDRSNVSLMDLWLNQLTNEVFILVSLHGTSASKGTIATWVKISTSTSGSSINITTYDTAGSFTWTKDPRTKFITAYGWNGGCGGGSGRRGLSTASGGGAGGSFAGFFYYEGNASNFGATEPVEIGAGGAGGAAVVVNNTDGNPGSIGGQSSFGNIFFNIISTPSGGGINGESVSGDAGTIYDRFYEVTVTIGDGGEGELVDGTNANPMGESGGFFYGSTGGGGGAGADAVVERTGGNGGEVIGLDDSTVLLAGGAGGIESGTIDGAPGNAGNPTSGGLLYGGTGGGGGGGQSVGLVAGNGGIGGFPGGSGGGGGGSLNGTPSGAGGNGASGAVIVIEFF